MRARIKGTDIIVECKGVGTMLNDTGKGIGCRYLTGDLKGANETIPADCLVEIEGVDWTKLYPSMVINFTAALLANRVRKTPDYKREMINTAFEYADEIKKRIDNKML